MSSDLRRADEYLAAVADALAIDDRYLPDWSLDFEVADDEWTLDDVIDLCE
ncbi:hypothetical protein IL252_14510 (plasmid) [Halomicrobium sp. IBSBa]|uniref:hypothetical protein n=1 Tax=unclassified Halomicrobium TaxID=2610901 RepID=UPI001ABF761D|nr:hypothetical protein [Halomicrobium sp. IBSBa]MBO4249029.1 hypothetical protein [Halomicrobium sp. IBSBa]